MFYEQQVPYRQDITALYRGSVAAGGPAYLPPLLVSKLRCCVRLLRLGQLRVPWLNHACQIEVREGEIPRIVSVCLRLQAAFTMSLALLRCAILFFRNAFPVHNSPKSDHKTMT
jgi:hypothetical protein